MIINQFDARTLANMDVALERACTGLPVGESHTARKQIASAILACAVGGDTTLSGLTDAAMTAAAALSPRRRRKGLPVTQISQIGR